MRADPLDALRVEVEQYIAAPPEQVWAMLTDVPEMARWSPEVVEASWLDRPVSEGARFRATNRRGGMEWSVTCHVLASEAPTRFVWCVSDPASPSSTWSYDLAPREAGTLVTQRFQHGPGASLVREMASARGADADGIVRWRAEMLAADMAGVLARAANVLEEG
ncbi:SRPBCC family protein [Streptomyces bambusae]|uniref:SRPBCC family protein n=1 Tax=Streptomyces bambusae TaxID=1550616 RepID=UPI001CFE6D7B|nr:SRPBCC family protein [Streptomyces bambusae]MCB5167461.1 SRPBCC family protein [Streptomyces bambusae]